MLAYKGFDKGYKCRGYQFDRHGVNREEKAKCVESGFHAALNPLDCFDYYPDTKRSVYCIVDCTDDVHEDCSDTKIACTEMKILRDLTLHDMILHAILYIQRHPQEALHSRVQRDCATARSGFAIAYGYNPIARGQSGDILAFVQINHAKKITGTCIMTVGKSKGIKPGIYYNIRGDEVNESV